MLAAAVSKCSSKSKMLNIKIEESSPSVNLITTSINKYFSQHPKILDFISSNKHLVNNKPCLGSKCRLKAVCQFQIGKIIETVHRVS